MSNLVNRLAEHELSGLEVFSNKHGSLGGWLVQENNLYQLDLSDYVKSITVYLPQKDIVTQYSGRWLAQNKKIFQHSTRNSPIILNVKLQLIKAKKESILLKIKKYSIKNTINTHFFGIIENIFIEEFDQRAINKFKLIWTNSFQNEEINYLEKILTDSEIKKKLISELMFIFKPNNILIIKKNINPLYIKSNLDAIINAVYDKFNVTLKYNLSFTNLIKNDEAIKK